MKSSSGSNREAPNENNNLVMFPSSKNFKVDLTSVDLGPDPLSELLQEYSHLTDEDIIDYLPDEDDERFNASIFDEETLDGDSFDSLDAFMNRNQRGEVLTPDDLLIKAINERIQAIKDTKERIKFYLDEIEMFLPSRKR